MLTMISKSNMNKYKCFVCKKAYSTQRALSVHVNKSEFCTEFSGTNVTSNSNVCGIYLPVSKSTLPNNICKNEDIQSSKIQSVDKIIIPNDDSNNADNTNIDNNNDDMCIESGIFCEDGITVYHNNLVHEVKLFKILNDLSAPLYAYNEIMKWAYDANLSRFNFDAKNKTYNQVIKDLQKSLNMEAFRPDTITVKLMGTDERELKVTV